MPSMKHYTLSEYIDKDFDDFIGFEMNEDVSCANKTRLLLRSALEGRNDMNSFYREVGSKNPIFTNLVHIKLVAYALNHHFAPSSAFQSCKGGAK
jgi:hypothetical protein